MGFGAKQALLVVWTWCLSLIFLIWKMGIINASFKWWWWALNGIIKLNALMQYLIQNWHFTNSGSTFSYPLTSSPEPPLLSASLMNLWKFNPYLRMHFGLPRSYIAIRGYSLLESRVPKMFSSLRDFSISKMFRLEEKTTGWFLFLEMSSKDF